MTVAPGLLEAHTEAGGPGHPAAHNRHCRRSPNPARTNFHRHIRNRPDNRNTPARSIPDTAVRHRQIQIGRSAGKGAGDDAHRGSDHTEDERNLFQSRSAFCNWVRCCAFDSPSSLRRRHTAEHTDEEQTNEKQAGENRRRIEKEQTS